MSFEFSRFVGGLALAMMLVGVVSCASSKRPQAYVYTPAPEQGAVQPREPAAAPPSRRVEREEPQAARSAAPARRAAAEPAGIPAGGEPVSGLEERVETRELARAPNVPDDLQVTHTQSFPEAGTSYRLKSNDPLIIQLRGIPHGDNYEVIVDDRGFVHLPLIRPVQAAGLTISQLQRTIQNDYVDQQIYRQVTVNVILPTQSYFVRGEVRQPGRFPLTSGMTILKAIATAGGYTEFANPRRINIIRGGETMVENARQMEQNPEEDLDVKADDVIIVPRSIF